MMQPSPSGMPAGQPAAGPRGDPISQAGAALRVILRNRRRAPFLDVFGSSLLWVLTASVVFGAAVWLALDSLWLGIAALVGTWLVVWWVEETVRRPMVGVWPIVIAVSFAACCVGVVWGRRLGHQQITFVTWVTFLDYLPLLVVFVMTCLSGGVFTSLHHRQPRVITTIGMSTVALAASSPVIGYALWGWLVAFAFMGVVRWWRGHLLAAARVGVVAERAGLSFSEPHGDMAIAGGDALGGDMKTAHIETGLMAEEATARMLAGLPATWTVLHSRCLPGHGDVDFDHVAVGPPGVLLIDTKRWSGRLECRAVADDDDDDAVDDDAGVGVQWSINGSVERAQKLVSSSAIEAEMMSRHLGAPDRFVVPVIVPHGLELPAPGQTLDAALTRWEEQDVWEVDPADDTMERAVRTERVDVSYEVPAHVVAPEYLVQFLTSLPPRPAGLIPDWYAREGDGAAARYARDVAAVFDRAFPRAGV